MIPSSNFPPIPQINTHNLTNTGAGGVTPDSGQGQGNYIPPADTGPSGTFIANRHATVPCDGGRNEPGYGSATGNANRLLPISETEEPPVRSSGWTLELLTAYMGYLKVQYQKDVFSDDFYWACFGPYFNMSDIHFDWLKHAYCGDNQNYQNAGFVDMHKYLTSKKLQKNHEGDGIIGYIRGLLLINPISPEKLADLERKFEERGRGIEVDCNKNFEQLTEERKGFYFSHTPAKREILSRNILLYLKAKPHVLQRYPILNEVIRSYESHGSGDSFYNFLSKKVAERADGPLEQEYRKLHFYIEKALVANYCLSTNVGFFYSLAKEMHENAQIQ